MIAIRKEKREEAMAKKRINVGGASGGAEINPNVFNDASDSTAMTHEQRTNAKLESLPQMVDGVNSPDPAVQLDATTRFRKLLSIERNPPIKEVVATGVVGKFVEFLQRVDFPQLQFEAAWALTNVASGTSEDTATVINSGAGLSLCSCCLRRAKT